MTFPTKYQTDGVTSEWSFDWPFLDRSHVFVTVNDAARSFSFIDDGTIRCVDSLGNPFAAGLPLVINRATPDLVDLARFKDAANLTAADLNRARLQLLFLIQERSGGMAGAVGTVISNLTNEIETISGALDTIAETQGVLHAGLGQMQGLADRVSVVENGAQALLDQIQQEIDNRVAGDSTLASRVDSMNLKVVNLSASVQSDINLLQSNDAILASQTSKIQAQIDALDTGGDGQTEDDILSASLITTAIASVKKDAALVQSITTLEATLKETIDGRLTQVEAMVQTEQTARADADKALAQQITTLQSQINDNIAQVVQDMNTSVDAVNGKVTGLQAQYTLKAQVKRDDGTVVMGGIGLAATANDAYVGSKLVLMADSILFADPNTPNGELVTFLEAGLVDGQATLIVPSTRVGDQTIPGRVLVDGSIEARSIKANSITGDKLVAGTIDTDRLAVGLGANLLKNSTFVQGLVEWGLTWTSTPGTSSATETAGVNLSAAWYGPGLNVAWMRSTSQTGVTDINNGYSDLYASRVPVLSSTYYEFSVYAGNYGGATIDIGINWYDSAGAFIGSGGYIGAGSQFATTVSLTSAQVLSNLPRIGGIAKSPVNAASAQVVVRKSFPAAAENWAFLAHPMLAQTSASATRLSPYTPSGLGTLITPAGISTPSLSALSATIGTLRTATSGARMEIESNQLRVYDANNVLRVRLGVW